MSAILCFVFVFVCYTFHIV